MYECYRRKESILIRAVCSNEEDEQLFNTNRSQAQRSM